MGNLHSGLAVNKVHAGEERGRAKPDSSRGSGRLKRSHAMPRGSIEADGSSKANNRSQRGHKLSRNTRIRQQQQANSRPDSYGDDLEKFTSAQGNVRESNAKKKSDPISRGTANNEQNIKRTRQLPENISPSSVLESSSVALVKGSAGNARSSGGGAKIDEQRKRDEIRDPLASSKHTNQLLGYEMKFDSQDYSGQDLSQNANNNLIKSSVHTGQASSRQQKAQVSQGKVEGSSEGLRKPPAGLNRSFSTYAALVSSPLMTIGTTGAVLNGSNKVTSFSTVLLNQEDQRQRVRNWLNSQPFPQYREVEKWPETEIEGEQHSKTIEEQDETTDMLADRGGIALASVSERSSEIDSSVNQSVCSVRMAKNDVEEEKEKEHKYSQVKENLTAMSDLGKSCSLCQYLGSIKSSDDDKTQFASEQLCKKSLDHQVGHDKPMSNPSDEAQVEPSIWTGIRQDTIRNDNCAYKLQELMIERVSLANEDKSRPIQLAHLGSAKNVELLATDIDLAASQNDKPLPGTTAQSGKAIQELADECQLADQRRTSINKTSRRGLSLDGGGYGGKSKQLSNLGRLRKIGMRARRGRSQSSKLIVISGSNVSYTIQDTQTSIDDREDEDDSKQTATLRLNDSNKESSDRNNNHLDNEQSSSSSSFPPGTARITTNNSSPDNDSDKTRQKAPLKKIDSCKKFLVKKISGSNSRALITRQQSKSRHSTPSCKAKQDLFATQKPIKAAEFDNTIDDLAVRGLIVCDTLDLNSNPVGTASAPLKDEMLSENALLVTPASLEPIESDQNSMLDSVQMDWHNSQMADSGPTDLKGLDETVRACRIAAKRLRELVAHLEHGSVPQSVLYQTLEHAVSVLDSVTMDQISRVSDEEDGDLSEVQSDAVPNEVRKWLETTFTRNSISQKRRSEDKLKFRSVANAIRAGIVVDRIYRRTSASIPFVSAEVSSLLKSIDDWSFDCFSINQVSNGQVLKSVGYELFSRYGLLYKFKIPTTVLKNFLTQVELGYVKHKNPYHNNLHAADVTQTVHYMLWQAGLTNWLTDLEIFATLLAAIIHDYLHTGTTNNFHVMSQSDTALLYNDRAVLENFHICQAFTLMRNEDCNILANLTKDEYREFRSLVIDMVLATDMSSHFQQIKAMKNVLNHTDNFIADKSKILSLVIHISDISHPAKEWELHSNWTQLLMEEFFRQGDREKELGLECSPLCDRETTLVAESQLGFIEFIVNPSLEVCGDVLDRVQHQMAEVNARPALSAATKTQVAAIEPPPSHHSDKELKSRTSMDKNSSSGSIEGSTHSSLAASFVSSETLTSNLRKMIVSSSATIGRKLNLGSSRGKPDSELAAASDFEARKANYKHPVIQNEPNARSKSAGSRVQLSSRRDDNINLDNASDNLTGSTASEIGGELTQIEEASLKTPLVNRFGQPVVVMDRKNSGLSTYNRAGALPLRIYRPWVKCLERNKKMWQDRAIKDAQTRELKEKLKQQSQIGPGEST